MNNLVAFGAVLFMAFAVSEISAICCGRGKHGYCNDCARTSLTGHRKCCGSGSGHGYGCNVFCCSCRACRSGHPIITYASGWILSKKYTCKVRYGDSEKEVADVNDLRDTWNAFDEIDTDGNSVISPNEFMDAMASKMADHESAHLLASDLLKSNDAEEIGSFLDAVNEKDAQDDMAQLLVREFRALDTDKDGLIQAQEFDKDLN